MSAAADLPTVAAARAMLQARNADRNSMRFPDHASYLRYQCGIAEIQVRQQARLAAAARQQPVVAAPLIRSKELVTADSLCTGAEVTKDMFVADYTDSVDPSTFADMADLIPDNIVAGDKSEEDRFQACAWDDWGDDVFDSWGFFFLYDVASRKYYFPLLTPQNQDDGILTTQTFSAFNRVFTVTHGYTVQGIFKMDISVNDSRPFRFGAYGNMGSNGGEYTEELVQNVTLGNTALKLFYRMDQQADSDTERLYTYMIPRRSEENRERAFSATYYDGDMSLITGNLTRGVLIYFAKQNDVKEWVIHDLALSTDAALSPAPPGGSLLHSRGLTTAGGLTVGREPQKDMTDDYYDDEFNPFNYQSDFFPDMADFSDENIVAGDKADEDRILASGWEDLGDDIFDYWGNFFIYDVSSGKYYFPILSPQNEANGVITTQTFSAFDRTFTIKHGWAVTGIFKMDISVADNLPFRFGVYGNMGSDGDEVTSINRVPVTVDGFKFTLTYRKDAQERSSSERLFTYMIPYRVEENDTITSRVRYDDDDMAMISNEVTKGLLIYFAKSNDVREWVTSDLRVDV